MPRRCTLCAGAPLFAGLIFGDRRRYRRRPLRNALPLSVSGPVAGLTVIKARRDREYAELSDVPAAVVLAGVPARLLARPAPGSSANSSPSVTRHAGGDRPDPHPGRSRMPSALTARREGDLELHCQRANTFTRILDSPSASTTPRDPIAGSASPSCSGRRVKPKTATAVRLGPAQCRADRRDRNARRTQARVAIAGHASRAGSPSRSGFPNFRRSSRCPTSPGSASASSDHRDHARDRRQPRVAAERQASSSTRSTRGVARPDKNWEPLAQGAATSSPA